MINKVILIGNLGADPEIKAFDDGNSVARISVATSESYKDKSGNWQSITDWHTVTVWGKPVEFVNKYLKKGQKVFVEGKLKHRKYQNKDGKDAYSTEIVASTIKSLDKVEKSDNMPSPELNDFNNSNDLPF